MPAAESLPQAWRLLASDIRFCVVLGPAGWARRKPIGGYGAAWQSSCSCSSRWSSRGSWGPPDGRYLLRAERTRSPSTWSCWARVGAARASRARAARGAQAGAAPRGARGGGARARPWPIARATMVDPVPLAAERQAQAWLRDLDPEREAGAARRCSTACCSPHRIATADPYVHEVSPAQALVIRAGWGEGEQVADGHWVHARELPGTSAAAAGAAALAALRPQERLACAAGRPRRAAAVRGADAAGAPGPRPGHVSARRDGARAAYATALAELRGEGSRDLEMRIASSSELRPGVDWSRLAPRCRARSSSRR